MGRIITIPPITTAEYTKHEEPGIDPSFAASITPDAIEGP